MSGIGWGTWTFLAVIVIEAGFVLWWLLRRQD